MACYLWLAIYGWLFRFGCLGLAGYVLLAMFGLLCLAIFGLYMAFDFDFAVFGFPSCQSSNLNGCSLNGCVLDFPNEGV